MKPPFVTNFLLAGGILLLLTHCQHVNPEPPKAEGFDPPIPSAVSYLAGSITLPLSELQAKINKELDPVLLGNGTKKSGKQSIIPISIVRSGPVQIKYVDQQVRFSAPLQVQLEKLFSAKETTPSRKPFCAIHVDFMSPLVLTPTWRLLSHVKFVSYRWEVKPQIKLLGKIITLDNFAQRIIQKHQTAIENVIDSAVYKDLRLDRMVSPIWRDIQKPLSLDKQYGLWLLPKPNAVAASPINGDAQKITVPLLITLTPQTELTPQKPTYSPVELPRLKIIKSLPSAANLHVMSFVPYAQINRVAALLIKQKKVNLPVGSLTVNKATVYGGQHTVIVRTEVSGLVDGTLYLRGRPVFDTTTNTLRVNDLDFDAQTQTMLSGLTRGMLHRGLQHVLERLLTVSLGNEINRLPRIIDTAFEKSGAGKKTNLDIKAFRLIPEQIAVRPDGIQTLISVKSRVALHVEHL